MLGFSSIQMTYEGPPVEFNGIALLAVLSESTQAGMSSYIQRKDDEENSATATMRSIWTTVPQFRFSGLDPGDQIKQSPVSYTRVAYTLSVAVPKSTTQSDLYTLNGKLLVSEATTDFLNTYLPWNNNTMEAVETWGKSSVPVGTSCLPRSSDDSSSVYLEMATVFQVPLEWKATTGSPDQLLQVMRQTFLDHQDTYLNDYVREKALVSLASNQFYFSSETTSSADLKAGKVNC